MTEQYIETAITLARLYGIAETLYPWPYLENQKFLSIIRDWTEEFLRSEDQDLLQFFEDKII